MKATRITEFPAPYGARVRLRILKNSHRLPNGCWEWRGAIDWAGYGKFKVSLNGERRMTGSHRAAYLAFRGPIADELVIDHLCRNTRCVNPDHLEAVSNGENSARGDHSGKRGRSGKLRSAPLHHCGKHGRDDGYLRVHADEYTRWQCRICRRDHVARYRRRANTA